jgi:hypothetical protein
MPREDATVTVTGAVRSFVDADFRREYGWGWGVYPWGIGYYGYPWYSPVAVPEYFVRYERRPVLVASSITTAAGTQLISSKAGADAKAVGTSGTMKDTITDLSTVASGSAAQLAGRKVRLNDVRVDSVAGPRGFWAAGSKGQHVFVALDQTITKPSMRPGDHVMIAGEVQKAPKDRSRIDAHEWALSENDVNQLMQSGVFIRADAMMKH